MRNYYYARTITIHFIMISLKIPNYYARSVNQASYRALPKCGDAARAATSGISRHASSLSNTEIPQRFIHSQ